MNTPSTINRFFVSKDKELLQFDRIHNFLSKEAYWCVGIPKHNLKKAIDNSINFGIYEHDSQLQIGYARIVTDHATFAWLCDVYIEKKYRGKGLSKLLIQTVLEDQSLKGLRRICLATKDSHFLYEKYGFEVTKTPNFWMEIKENDIYKKA